jgi:arylsulfatase A-like enzyme
MKAVFEYGKKGASNRDDYLPLLPTSAMVFRDADYFTGHSGKWHLAGMRNDDLDMRIQPGERKRCPHPGPNQQGFEEYVSVLDGPGAPRQNELQVQATLYSRGCTALLQNDKHIGRAGGDPNELLCDCEARHAIRMMNASIAAKKPFFMQLWFHAPHGPWEELPRFNYLYPDRSAEPVNKLPLCSENAAARTCATGRGPNARKETRTGRLIDKYKTMVSSMDRSIGTVLSFLRDMGVERDTLVVFTSDNGFENVCGPGGVAGGAGGLKGSKRFLYEGGVRVPTIWQWVGTIPAGKNISNFGISTDLYPTFLDAAGITAPPNVKLDGISLLPLLTTAAEGASKRKRTGRRTANERVAMWHNDFEGPRSSALMVYDFKVMLDKDNKVTEMYDIRTDKYEKVNLVRVLKPHELLKSPPLRDLGLNQRNITARSFHDLSFRARPAVHQWIISHVYSLIKDFAEYGNEAHKLYMKENRGRLYTPTPESDIRSFVENPYKIISREKAAAIKRDLLNGTCSTPCHCESPRGVSKLTPSLPFERVPNAHTNIIPGMVQDASVLLGLRSAGQSSILSGLMESMHLK